MLLKGVDFLEAALDTNIQYLSGVGPKRAALYHKLDIHAIRDLLYYFPRAILIFLLPASLRMLLPGRSVLFGRVW